MPAAAGRSGGGSRRGCKAWEGGGDLAEQGYTRAGHTVPGTQGQDEPLMLRTWPRACRLAMGVTLYVTRYVGAARHPRNVQFGPGLTSHAAHSVQEQ